MQAEQNERPTEIAVWLNLPPSTAANNIISSQERLANVIPSAFRASQGFMTYPDSGSGIPTPTYRTEIDNPDVFQIIGLGLSDRELARIYRPAASSEHCSHRVIATAGDPRV